MRKKLWNCEDGEFLFWCLLTIIKFIGKVLFATFKTKATCMLKQRTTFKINYPRYEH